MPYMVYFLEKDAFFHEIFQAGACPNLKDSSIYEFFFYSYVQDIDVGIFNFFALSATHLCFAKYIILEKDDLFHEIFQVGACPKLKDSSEYERYSIHMYKARSNLHLQQFSPICESLIPCTVHCLEKDDFS